MGLRTAGAPKFAGTVLIGFVLIGTVLIGFVSGCGGASMAVPDSLVPLGPPRPVNIEQASPTTVAVTTTTSGPAPTAGPTTTTTEVFFVLDAPLTTTTAETFETIPADVVIVVVPLPDDMIAETSVLETETTTNLDGTVLVEGVEPAPTTVPSAGNEGG